MSVVNGRPLLTIDFSELWREPTEQEKEQWKISQQFAELKSRHEQFLRDREDKERRLLYAIAEKLGIDVDNI